MLRSHVEHCGTLYGPPMRLRLIASVSFFYRRRRKPKAQISVAFEVNSSSYIFRTTRKHVHMHTIQYNTIPTTILNSVLQQPQGRIRLWANVADTVAEMNANDVASELLPPVLMAAPLPHVHFLMQAPSNKRTVRGGGMKFNRFKMSVTVSQSVI